MKSKAVYILEFMLSKYGKVLKEIKVDKKEIWKPGSVFVTKHIKEVLYSKSNI